MAPLFRALGLCAATVSLTACDAEPPRRALSCKTLNVETREGALVGIEDMVLGLEGQLYLSAYNRRDPAASPAGVFETVLPTQSDDLEANRVTRSQHGILPHGIAATGDGQRLYVIERRTEGLNRLSVYDAPRAEDRLWRGPTVVWDADEYDQPSKVCHMNDVMLANEALYISNDRAACGGMRLAIETVFGISNGSVVTLENASIGNAKQDLDFANGLASGQDGRILVSETRGRRLADVHGTTTYELPGAPDNITAGATGFWVPLFPSLLRYALYRADLPGALKKSWIYYKPYFEEPASLFETSDFAGATTALEVNGGILLSGAYTAGLAFCEVPDFKSQDPS